MLGAGANPIPQTKARPGTQQAFDRMFTMTRAIQPKAGQPKPPPRGNKAKVKFNMLGDKRYATVNHEKHEKWILRKYTGNTAAQMKACRFCHSATQAGFAEPHFSKAVPSWITFARKAGGKPSQKKAKKVIHKTNLPGCGGCHKKENGKPRSKPQIPGTQEAPVRQKGNDASCKKCHGNQNMQK